MSELKQIERLPEEIELWDGIDPLVLKQKLSSVYPVLLYDKIQELIDAHNELEKNTLDTFNALLDKLSK